MSSEKKTTCKIFLQIHNSHISKPSRLITTVVPTIVYGFTLSFDLPTFPRKQRNGQTLGSILSDLFVIDHGLLYSYVKYKTKNNMNQISFTFIDRLIEQYIDFNLCKKSLA